MIEGDTIFETDYLFFIYTAFFFAVCLFSLIFNTILLKFSKNLGIRDREITEIRWSDVSKPCLGGIGFFIVFLLSISTFSIFFDADDVFHNSQALGLIACTGLAFIMGLADDAYDTRPLLKFAVQIFCGIILIISGTSIHLFENDILNYALTIFWVVGIMNSINMLDNMDAITTVVSCFIILTALLLLLNNDGFLNFNFITLLGILAGLLGFLFFNWNPSRMFMGDTGSQFLGIFLAYLGINFFWNAPGSDGELLPSRQFIVTISVFILPIVDTCIVFFNRISKKQSPFIGGKDHTTHSLSYMGLSDSQVALAFAGISATSLSICIIILYFIKSWNWWYAFGFGLYFLTILGTFFFISRYVQKKRMND